MQKPVETMIVPKPDHWKWLRWHVRAWLFIALGSAIFVFGIVIAWNFGSHSRLLDERETAEARIALQQRALDQRIDEIEEQNAVAKLALERRIIELSDRQGVAGVQDGATPAKSPFPLETVMRSIVEIVCIDNVDPDVYYTGSGTVVDPSGVIMTNHHLLLSDDGSIIKYCGVGFTDDLQDPPSIAYIATSMLVHKETDLAILRITETVDDGPMPASFPAISLKDSAGASAALNLGDPVYIGGYPNIGADTFTFTQGVVSGRVGPTFIKTSAIIDTGASGGAAFDSSGRYIGVPTAAARGEIGGSLGYLIGSDIVEKFLRDYYSKKSDVSDPVN